MMQSDEERREFLVARTGKRSSSDLTYREATLVLDLLFAMQRGERPATMRPDGATRFEIEKLSALRSELGPARFDGLARHMTHGRPADVGLMSGREARALLEAAKSILAREAGRSRISGRDLNAENAENAEKDGGGNEIGK